MLFIVLDDTGFGQLGCYGSPIATPHLDSLAAGGLRYNRMHTTALCSPSRSCIITGRNHHSNGMAAITELATGYPGYDGNIPFENGFLSEMLQQHGYNTYMIGKWHLMPSEQESAAGPYDRWPLGRGFDRFYGFLGGDTSQWYPELVYDNHQVEPPRSPAGGLSPDRGPGRSRDRRSSPTRSRSAPDKPFYLHFCTGATHAPHHVAKEWADRYAGRFDEGWDAYRREVFARQKELGVVPADAELSRHDPDVPEWDSLSPDARRLAARMMEVYAGFLSHTDAQIGRLLDFLRETGELDNTLIMVDLRQRRERRGRGRPAPPTRPSSSTTPRSRWRTAWPSSTRSAGRPPSTTTRGAGPGPATPRSAGGSGKPTGVARATRSWCTGPRASPHAARSASSTRTSSTWSPRCSTCSGSNRPPAIRGVTQAPLHGVSFAHTFDDADAPTRHYTQYFEMFGHRAIDHNGWRAVCPWPGPSFAEADVPFGTPITADTLAMLDAERWELYHAAEDFAENYDVAAENRGKVIELIAQWYVEAGRYSVLPIDGSVVTRLMTERPQLTEARTSYTFWPGTEMRARLRRAAGAQPPAQHHRRRRHPGGRRRGRAAVPGRQHRRVHVLRAATSGCTTPTTTSAARSTACPRRIRCPRAATGCGSSSSPPAKPDFAHGRGAPGRAQLYVDDQLVAQAEIPVTVPIAFNPGGLTCGSNPGAPIVADYQSPFRFTGTLHQVTVDVSGELIIDSEAEMRMAMSRQ